MYLRSVTIHGLSDLPHFTIDGLGRTVTIRGPSPASSAVGDGLGVLFGAMNESVLRQLLVGWGLIRQEDEAEIETEPLPAQAIGPTAIEQDRRLGPRQSPHPRRGRRALIPRWRRPFESAATEPRLGTALTESPIVHVKSARTSAEAGTCCPFQFSRW